MVAVDGAWTGLRAHALARRRRGRLAPGLRHAAQQPARRVGHRSRRATARRPPREPHGAEPRLRRRTGSSSRSAQQERRGSERPSRPCSRPILDEGHDAETAVALPRVHPTLDARRRRAGRRRGRPRRRSRRAAARCAAGIVSTTTSAESAASAEPVPQATRVEAAPRSFSDATSGAACRCGGSDDTARRAPSSRGTRR